MRIIYSFRGLAAAAIGLGLALGGCAGSSGNRGADAPPAADLRLVSEPLSEAEQSPGAGRPVYAAKRDLPSGVYAVDTARAVLLRVSALEDYLNSVLDRVASPIVSADYTGPVGLFVTSENYIKGLTTPGNDIIVSVELFEKAGNEEEIAFILAHELSHVVRADLERTEVLAEQDRFADNLRRVTRLAQKLGNRYQSVVEGDRDEADSILELRRKIDLAVHALQLALESQIGPAWNRNQEEIADKAAADLLHKAGYNPLNAKGMFGKLGEAEAQRNAAVERHAREIARLTAELAGIRDDDPMLGKINSAGLEAGGDLLGKITGLFTTSPYEAAEDRNEAYTAYVGRKFGITQATPGTIRGLKRVKEKDPDYTVAKDRLKKARDAEDLFEEGYALAGAGSERADKLNESVELALEAIEAPGGNMGLPRMVFHRIRKEMGEERLARLNLEAIVDQPALGPAPTIQMARFLAETNVDEGALGLVDRLAESYGKTAALPLGFDVSLELGHLDQAREILEQCLLQVSDLYVRTQCQKRKSEFIDVGEEQDGDEGWLDGVLE